MATDFAIQQRTTSEINKARDTLREAELGIQRAQAKITSLRSLPTSEWNERQITEVLPQTIETHQTTISEVRARIESLKSGECRREMIGLIKESQQRQREMEESKREKDEARRAKRLEQRGIYNQWRDGERQSRREINQGKGSLRRGGDYFWRVVADFESKHMAAKLKTMPNNRGYRYRGMEFYGELPPEMNADGTPRPVVLFESRARQQYIHEYTERSYKMFRKNPRGRKTLVSETPRRQIGRANIMDFVVPAKPKKQRK